MRAETDDRQVGLLPLYKDPQVVRDHERLKGRDPAGRRSREGPPGACSKSGRAMAHKVPLSLPKFGLLLRRYRLAAGLSQEALAERARMSIDGISALERGYRRSPQRETLELLAGALALDGAQRRDFEAAARADAARRARPASVTVGPWPQPDTAALPLSLTTYVGRELDMAAIRKLLYERRFVTLTGAGGIGKTRAALQVAASLGEDFAYPPRFVSLTTAGNPSSVTQTVAAALNVQEVPDRSLRETLLSYLNAKAMLLILDNCEHVIDGVAEVAETLLARCPRVRILATSRQPVGAAGEHTYRLPSLAVPPPKALHQLTAAEALGYSAVRLFADRARALSDRFELTDEQAPAVAELCRHLDGIPLAIELAAARTNVLTAQALTERLEERFRLLVGGRRTALPRQQTMRAAIDWSYNLLPEPEQRLFERLSVFSGGCTLSMAARVCGDEGAQEADTLDLLAALADKSLAIADFDAATTRYRLLESFREYAREKLVARGELAALSHRHARAYLELAREYNQASDANLDELFEETVASELENWRAALQWALVARNDALLGQELAGALNSLWHAFAPVEGRRWLLAAAEQIDERTPIEVLAALSFAQANVALVLRECAAQLAHAEAALSHYRALRDELGIAQALSRVGHALVWTDRIPEALPVLSEALATARKLRNRRLTAFALRALGFASFRNGDYVTARQHASEAVQILQATGATLAAAGAMEDLVEYEFAAGDPQAAAQHATAIVEMMRGANIAPRVLSATLSQLACCLNVLSRYDEAETCAREALDLAWRHGLDELVPEALQHVVAGDILRRQLSPDVPGETWIRGARVLGFADAGFAVRDPARSPLERQEYDRVLAVLSSALGEAAVADALASGAGLTAEEAIDELFKPAPDPPLAGPLG